MANRKPLVAGNWKMNGSLELVATLAEVITKIDTSNVDVLVFPPFPLIKPALDAGLKAGAQTVSENNAGAFTGEVDAKLVNELGAEYTLVGHSERRAIYGESNEVVAAKFAKAQEQNLKPILCVGESEQEREQELTEQVVWQQIDAVISKLGVDALANSVIAYEPVWAIGTGKTASPEQAQNVHKFIRSKLAELNGELADKIQLLYGGSVNENNSEQLFAQPDIDGGLIGGASLKADSFTAIINSAKGNG